MLSPPKSAPATAASRVHHADPFVMASQPAPFTSTAATTGTTAANPTHGTSPPSKLSVISSTSSLPSNAPSAAAARLLRSSSSKLSDTQTSATFVQQAVVTRSSTASGTPAITGGNTSSSLHVAARNPASGRDRSNTQMHQVQTLRPHAKPLLFSDVPDVPAGGHQSVD